MDDELSASFYDNNEVHVQLVVEDIFRNWDNRSSQGRYNALLTTNVGARRPSTPMAMMYFDEFQRVNEQRKAEGKSTLKVAVTFSLNTKNNEPMLKDNQGLYRAIMAYNEEFKTKFGTDDVKAYTQDVISRLNKTAQDENYLDIVIVIDQLLTGFDAPELNTLYVDRTLKGAALIQAYSRTNRISNRIEKPWGRIINYRWPAQNEKLMNDALAVYSEKSSANLQIANEQNIADGLLAPPFETVFQSVKTYVDELKLLTEGFTTLPPSEWQKEAMFYALRNYNREVTKLRLYDADSYPNYVEYHEGDNRKEVLNKALGMTNDQESLLTGALTNELKSYIAKKKNIPFVQVELKMTHVKAVEVDYDYLTELLSKFMNSVHDRE